MRFWRDGRAPQEALQIQEGSIWVQPLLLLDDEEEGLWLMFRNNDWKKYSELCKSSPSHYSLASTNQRLQYLKLSLASQSFSNRLRPSSSKTYDHDRQCVVSKECLLTFVSGILNHMDEELLEEWFSSMTWWHVSCEASLEDLNLLDDVGSCNMSFAHWCAWFEEYPYRTVCAYDSRRCNAESWGTKFQKKKAWHGTTSPLGRLYNLVTVSVDLWHRKVWMKAFCQVFQ